MIVIYRKAGLESRV